MKFKTLELNKADIQKVVETIGNNNSSENMAEAIIEFYKAQYDLFIKDFSYSKYIKADTEARKKWDFLPVSIVYIIGDEYNQRSFKSIIQEINNIILYKAINKRKKPE